MKKNISEEAYYQRLKVLGNVNKSINETKTLNVSTLLDVKKAPDGLYYGIIKENHNYFLKKGGTTKSSDILDYNYIGGLSNKMDYQYASLSEADKQRNMYFININESDDKVVEDAKEEIKSANSKLDNLDNATKIAKETPAPEITEPETKPMVEPTDDDIETSDTDEETATTDEADIKEIEKQLGKLTNKIRKTVLTSSQTKSYVNSFLSSFKDKFPKLEVEDREKMADKILKIENIDANDAADTDNINESKCSECSSFSEYTESRGYNIKNITECSDDEMSNLISGYASAHNDDMNDGDFESVALFVNPNIINSLENEYAHNSYVNKLKPYTDSLNETNEEDKKLKIKKLKWVKKIKENDVANTEVKLANDSNNLGIVAENKNQALMLRKYIQNRLNEKIGLTKTMISENKKTDKLKMIDKLIDAEYELLINL